MHLRGKMDGQDNSIEERRQLRLERLLKRVGLMPAGPARKRIQDEVMRERGMFHIMDENRAIASEAQRPEVRASVARQRRLTGATGTPERQTSILKAVASRKVDNPDLTPGEHQAQWEREVEAARRQSRQPDFDAVKIWASENILNRIGALAFVRKRQHHHELAAERLKALYEARYGMVGGAIDPSIEPVDTSSRAHDAGMAARIDRTIAIEDAETRMGPEPFRRLVAHIVLAVPCEQFADTMPGGKPNYRQVQKRVDLLLADLDALASIWGVLPRAA